MFVFRLGEGIHVYRRYILYYYNYDYVCIVQRVFKHSSATVVTLYISGAVDGKHIVIESPASSGSDYFNYKDQFSVVMLAVVDSNYRFLFVDAGTNGRINDSTIWKNSSFFSAMESDTLNLPPPSKIADNSMVLPYVFVGDSAFALTSRMMKPYPEARVDREQRIFNYRLYYDFV